jgi:hypothetical protein
MGIPDRTRRCIAGNSDHLFASSGMCRSRLSASSIGDQTAAGISFALLPAPLTRRADRLARK